MKNIEKPEAALASRMAEAPESVVAKAGVQVWNPMVPT